MRSYYSETFPTICLLFDLMFAACNFVAPTDNLGFHWNDLFYDVKCKIGNLIMFVQNKEMLLINAARKAWHCNKNLISVTRQ